MSDKSNKYGYVGVDIPAQSFGNNKGVFNPAEINELVADNKWTTFGQLELIETKTYSSSLVYIDFTDIKQDIYNVHFLTYNNVQGTSGGSLDLCARLYANGGWYSGPPYYQKAFQYGNTGGTFAEDKSTGDTTILSIAGNYENAVANGYLYFYNLGDNSKYSFVTSHSFFTHPTAGAYMKFGSAVLPQSNQVTGIRFFNLTGATFTDYDISLYGIRYS
jgi:hypothetical protein